MRQIIARAGGRTLERTTKRDVVLAVDIGSTMSKGVIIDREARIVASTSICQPETEGQSGHHEHDAQKTWWRGFVTVVRSMLQSARVDPATIKCVCVTGLFPCFCPTDHDGIPLHPALLYDDNRALDYVREAYREQAIGIEGNELAGRIAWFKAEHPQLATKLRRVFSCHNYVVFRLTGRYCVDGHTAFLFGSVFDPTSFAWDQRELTRLGLDATLLPELVAPEELAGYVQREAARESGLNVGTPVIAGTGDTFASLLGSGAVRRGDVFAYYGTTTSIIELTQPAEDLFVARNYKATDDGILWHCSLIRSGRRFDELLRLIRQDPTNNQTKGAFGLLEADVDPTKASWCNALYFPQIGPASQFNTVSPSFAGFLGIPFGVHVADIYRVMVEGLGYMIRHTLQDNHLQDPGIRWFAAGGGTNSEKFCQILADTLNVTQVVVPNSTTAIGGAIAAGHFAGFFDIEEVSARRISQGRAFSPLSHLRDYYDRRNSEFATAYDALHTIWRARDGSNGTPDGSQGI